MSDLFEVAAIKKFRFETPQGNLSAEDLLDLPLESNRGKANLDDIAIALSQQVEFKPKSFVSKVDTGNETINQKFELVKYIIGLKVAARDAADTARANKEKKQQILGLIAAKETEALGATSLEELKAMAEAL